MATWAHLLYFILGITYIKIKKEMKTPVSSRNGIYSLLYLIIFAYFSKLPPNLISLNESEKSPSEATFPLGLDNLDVFVGITPSGLCMTTYDPVFLKPALMCNAYRLSEDPKNPPMEEICSSK